MFARPRFALGRFHARVLLVTAALSLLPLAPVLLAQVGKSKTKTKSTVPPGAIKQLDVRVTEMQDRLLRDATEIAKGYEDAGEFDRAKWMLEVLEKLDPKLPGLKDKIKQLTDRSLDATEFELDMDVSKGWTPAVGMVEAGRLVRISATGEYKFVATMNVTPNGIPTDDTGADLIAGIPVGALVGLIYDPKDRKPGKPFEIKAQREWTPRESGLLQLKVNLPAGHKSTGKLTLRFGGIGPLSN